MECRGHEGDHYLEVANQNNSYTISTEAIRGEILDVNGVSLAVNFTGLKIYFDRFTIDENKVNDIILNLVEKEYFNFEQSMVGSPDFGAIHVLIFMLLY